MERAVPHGLTSPRTDRSFIVIDGKQFNCVEGSAWLDYFFDPVLNLYFIVDEDSRIRAALASEDVARSWCKSACIFAAAPMKNADIQKLHDHMTGLRWRLGRYISASGCFLWTHRDAEIGVEITDFIAAQAEEMAAF